MEGERGLILHSNGKAIVAVECRPPSMTVLRSSMFLLITPHPSSVSKSNKVIGSPWLKLLDQTLVCLWVLRKRYRCCLCFPQLKEI